MNLHVVEHGRFFTPLDEELCNSVCVIGTGIRDELFGAPEDVGREIIPIGEIVNINGQPFTIVGMFQRYESEQEQKERELREREAKTAPKLPDAQTGVKRRRGHFHSGASWAFRRKNYTVYIPLHSMWLRFRTGDTRSGVVDTTLSDIDLKVASLEQLEPALQQVRNIMLMRHRGIEDFTLRTQENATENINATIRNARMSGGLIAAISLIVGGIGIMNIMLASILERTREIGVRRALGARRSDIVRQFLIETILISFVGGTIGVIVGAGMSRLIGVFAGWSTIVTTSSILLAFLVSVSIGLVFGLYPARRAAHLDPIEALRYE
jgi:putative ABC transport system permease protein